MRLFYLVIVTVAHFVDGYLRTYSFETTSDGDIPNKGDITDFDKRELENYLIVWGSFEHSVGGALIAGPLLFWLFCCLHIA